jgi:hypothetical protein
MRGESCSKRVVIVGTLSPWEGAIRGSLPAATSGQSRPLYGITIEWTWPHAGGYHEHPAPSHAALPDSRCLVACCSSTTGPDSSTSRRRRRRFPRSMIPIDFYTSTQLGVVCSWALRSFACWMSMPGTKSGMWLTNQRGVLERCRAEHFAGSVGCVCLQVLLLVLIPLCFSGFCVKLRFCASLLW